MSSNAALNHRIQLHYTTTLTLTTFLVICIVAIINIP